MHPQAQIRSLFEAISGGKFKMEAQIVSIGVSQKRSRVKNTLEPVVGSWSLPLDPATSK